MDGLAFCIDGIGSCGNGGGGPSTDTLEDVRARGNTIAGDINFASNRGVNVPLPTQADHLVNQAYVLDVLDGLRYKDSVRVATTGNITLSGAQTIDGIALSVGDRVLVWQQTTQTENGIYVVAAGAWTRSTDANTGEEISHSVVGAIEGTTYQRETFVNTNVGTITIGVTNITFVQRVTGIPSWSDNISINRSAPNSVFGEMYTYQFDPAIDTITTMQVSLRLSTPGSFFALVQLASNNGVNVYFDSAFTITVNSTVSQVFNVPRTATAFPGSPTTFNILVAGVGTSTLICDGVKFIGGA